MTESVLGNRYQVEARIGAGGMAEVYRGFDPILNRTVAVKVLLPQFARDTSFVQRFRREAQAAARLNQPNIVGVYDTGADDGTQYIVMEFVEGRTLGEFMETGRRPTPVQSAEIAQKICGALSAAHAVGVIHRDIKPGNVMVTREGTVKVMDFGIARVLGPETAPQTSAVLGTASYLSPEQAQGSPVDARTDIYSLGVVLYEMLTGRPPFMGDTPVAVAYKQVNETPVVPSQLNSDVPPRLDAVVMKALSKNPSNRYQTADEFSADLERVIKGQDVEATPLLGGAAAGAATQVISRPQHTEVLPPTEEPEGSGRKVWLGILIGILVVAIFGAAGYLLVSSLTGSNDNDPQVELVDYRGDTYLAAKQDLESKDMRVVRETEPTENADDIGIVLDQNPPGGTQVDRGSTVVLTVGVEPKRRDRAGPHRLDIGEASTALGEAGSARWGRGPRNPATRKTSIAHHPIRTGRRRPGGAGQVIDVFVSTGPELVTVPDVSSGCLAIPQARRDLEAVGLILEVGDAFPSAECPNPARIVAQDTAAGETAESGSVVVVHQGGADEGE